MPIARPARKMYREKMFNMSNQYEQQGSIGAALGNAILPGIGGLLGHAAESLFKTITGSGDYEEVEHIAKPLPTNNTILGLQSNPVTNAVENMHWNGLATRIAHREFVGSVNMTSGFSNFTFGIYPTSDSTPSLFPWLSTIAANFQKWKMLGCVFEYVPTSTNAISAGTPAVGTIAMAINYDILAPIASGPTGLVNLLNTQGSVSGRPQDCIVCPMECDPGLTPTNPLYMLQTGVNATPYIDPHWYVQGYLNFATDGPAAYNNCGQLWVTYDMLLISAYVASPAPPISINSDEMRPDSHVKALLQQRPAAVQCKVVSSSSCTDKKCSCRTACSCADC